jgi:hypothetical protein
MPNSLPVGLTVLPGGEPPALSAHSIDRWVEPPDVVDLTVHDVAVEQSSSPATANAELVSIEALSLTPSAALATREATISPSVSLLSSVAMGLLSLPEPSYPLVTSPFLPTRSKLPTLAPPADPPYRLGPHPTPVAFVFRDGSELRLADGSPSVERLREIARVLSRRD